MNANETSRRQALIELGHCRLFRDCLSHEDSGKDSGWDGHEVVTGPYVRVQDWTDYRLAAELGR